MEKKQPDSNMVWKVLEEENMLNEIVELSKSTTVMILKHSTRCSISSMALNRLESSWDFTKEEIIAYYLDLIQYRNISNAIADKFRIIHESPQILVIKNGECILNASHNSINVKSIREVI